MYFYRAYGLILQAALPLPELAVLEEDTAGRPERVDVVIRFGRVASSPAVASPENGRELSLVPEGIYLHWPDVGSFLVRDGREIIVDPRPGVEEQVLRLFILGTTLAMLLHQRGEVTVLHASAVAIAGRGAAFVGVKGAGKSTMAAALQARGHSLVADDIVAIVTTSGGPLVLPGFPYLKLWPDSVASLGYTPEELPRLRPELEKRGRRLTTGFSSTPVPLHAVYVLGLGAEAAIQPLNAHEAWQELMGHWYGARFGGELIRSLGLSSQFLQCAALARKIPVFRLIRPPALPALPQVARLVEAQWQAEKVSVEEGSC